MMRRLSGFIRNVRSILTRRGARLLRVGRRDDFLKHNDHDGHDASEGLAGGVRVVLTGVWRERGGD